MAWNTNLRGRLPITCLILQVTMVVLFGVFVRYDIQADAHWWLEKKRKNISSDVENEFYYRYPSFQDVHAMVFVGFGFLMTFLQRYGFSAVGFNFLLAAFGIQWALLMQGWFHYFEEGHIVLSVENIIQADFCVASSCVAFGAVLGKVSPMQLLIMTFFQVTLFTVNEFILLNLIEVHIQNATLAGGVGVGTAAEMMLTPYGALIVGFFCGIFSTLGFAYLTPFLESRHRIQDTCGIHNLHGIPGIIGGIVGAVTAAYSSPDVYGEPGIVHSFGFGSYKMDWNKRMQGRSQIFGLLLSLAMALVGGIIVGFILKLPFWGQAADENCFEDSIYWEVHEEVNTVYIPEDLAHKHSTSLVPAMPLVLPTTSASIVPPVPPTPPVSLATSAPSAALVH